MSKLAVSVLDLLKQIFPHNVIVDEHYVNFRGERLFFDYYVKDLGMLVECQGRQHDHYVEHFHGDAEGFRAAKKRDHAKIEYCEKNNLVLVHVYAGEELTKEMLLERMLMNTLRKKE